MEALLRNLRSKRLWEDEPATRSGYFLRELLAWARDLDSLLVRAVGAGCACFTKDDQDEFPVRHSKDHVDGVLQVVLGDEDRFQHGQNSDHLLVSF